jgi:outer membrane protein assembly factor BamB
MTWAAADVAWRTPLKGLGHSSPVVHGERIFLTSAEEEGRKRLVFCVHRDDGRVLWEDVAWTGTPEPSNQLNGWASASCVTDGERVYAFFGRGGGLFCYSIDGKRLWQKDLGHFEGPWGTAACPVLVGDLVIQNCDADSNAYLVAFNKRTGDEAWRVDREDFRGWSTPVLIEAGGRTELVLNGHSAVRGYDPATGKEIWSCASFNGRGEPTVTPAGGLLYLVNGLPGDCYAVRPGGNGDVTATHRVWHAGRNGRDLPSPIVIDGVLMIAGHRNCVITGYAAATGKELWRIRVGDEMSASPVAWNGRAFFVRTAGETLVIDPKAGEIVATNTVKHDRDELFRASLAPSDGQVFLRSDGALYCIGERSAGGK